MVNPQRQLFLLAFVLVALTCVASSFLGPWLTNHKGSWRGEPRAARAKLQTLIRDYRAKAGRWPSSMLEIEGLFPKQMEFEYIMICQNHPWNHRETGTLTDYMLIRDPAGDQIGVISYRFKLKKLKNFMELTVETPADSAAVLQ